MENWGLITFRMSSLLYDDGVTPVRSKERIASTVAHELAHQVRPGPGPRYPASLPRRRSGSATW